MYKYGNLIYDNAKGWVFIKEDEEENLNSETLISSLNYLGEDGWDLVCYADKLGYLLRLKK